jgi:hypothetical protein
MEAIMSIDFPNVARSYDETKHRVRFLGYDGMFEVRFFVAVDALVKDRPLRTVSEREYLAAFDGMRTKIMDVARRAYSKRRKDTVILNSADFA